MDPMPTPRPLRRQHLGPVGCITTAVCTTVAVAIVFTVFDLPTYLPAVAGVIVGFVEWERGERRLQPTLTTLFRALCWFAAGTWASVVAITGWSWTNVILLFGGFLVAALLAPAAARFD